MLAPCEKGRSVPGRANASPSLTASCSASLPAQKGRERCRAGQRLSLSHSGQLRSSAHRGLASYACNYARKAPRHAAVTSRRSSAARRGVSSPYPITDPQPPPGARRGCQIRREPASRQPRPPPVCPPSLTSIPLPGDEGRAPEPWSDSACGREPAETRLKRACQDSCVASLKGSTLVIV